MKKLILFIALISLFSCKPNRPATKLEAVHRGGEIVALITGAYDSIHCSTIEIVLLDNTFYQYTTISTRTEHDSMGIWANSKEVGEWIRVDSNHMQLYVPNDNKLRRIIPFDPNEQYRYMTAGAWSSCCDCPAYPSDCCMSLPTGDGFTCAPCPAYGCKYCISIWLDYAGHKSGGPSYIFMHPKLTESNFVIM